jgi:hypothetical protein
MRAVRSHVHECRRATAFSSASVRMAVSTSPHGKDDTGERRSLRNRRDSEVAVSEGVRHRKRCLLQSEVLGHIKGAGTFECSAGNRVPCWEP